MAPPVSHRPAARGRSPPWPGCFTAWGWAGCETLSQSIQFSATNGSGPAPLIHIDVKKMARFRKVVNLITGNRQQGHGAGVGYDRVHLAIHEATLLAFDEVLPHEQQP